MSGIVVVTTVHIKDGHHAAVVERLKGLAAQTHADVGCLAYAIHKDVDDPHVLVVVERWTSQVALENHLLQPYVRDIIDAAQELLERPPAPRVLEPVSAGDAGKGML